MKPTKEQIFELQTRRDKKDPGYYILLAIILVAGLPLMVIVLLLALIFGAPENDHTTKQYN
jgi:hypothetical protein